MNFWHSLDWRTEGIRVTAPVKWRCLDGLVGVYWEAESQAGAKGYYLASDPRIMIFFNDVSSRIRMSNRDEASSQHYRPMARALYIPAGQPMWTSSETTHRFSHLNLHIHKDRLLRFLAPSLGSSAASAALRTPVEIDDVDALEMLAGLLTEEVANPTRHSIYAESLVGSIVTGLLDIPEQGREKTDGRLTQAQMNKLLARFNASEGGKLPIGEMASIVGLSESWFASVFKQTTGQTPLQWQRTRRIDAARKLLIESALTVADVAAHLGFSDQAHLTKVFRQVTGETPAAWRRMQQVP